MGSKIEEDEKEHEASNCFEKARLEKVVNAEKVFAEDEKETHASSLVQRDEEGEGNAIEIGSEDVEAGMESDIKKTVGGKVDDEEKLEHSASGFDQKKNNEE